MWDFLRWDDEAENSKDRKQRKFALWDIKSACGNICLSAIAFFLQKQVARNWSCLNRGERLLLELRQSFFCGKQYIHGGLQK